MPCGLHAVDDLPSVDAFNADEIVKVLVFAAHRVDHVAQGAAAVSLSRDVQRSDCLPRVSANVVHEGLVQGGARTRMHAADQEDVLVQEVRHTR